MAELQIQPVQNDADLMAFITFPWEVYKGNPYWVPPLISERRDFLDPKENPFFEHARAQYFLARRGEEIVGTIGAFTNDLYNEFQGANVGFFGFFEVLDDSEAARELLATAEDWAKKAGHNSIIGPAQFSQNDEAGLLIDGFDNPPRVLMTYNPPRYQKFIETFGFQKAMDFWAYAKKMEGWLENIDPKLPRVIEKVRKRRNLHVRRMNMKDFNQEVERFKRIYNASWEANWGFVPFTEAEIDVLAKQLKQFIDPDLVFMVEYEGDPVGVILSLPDLNQPLRLAYPRPREPELLTMLKLAWHWKIRGRVDWFRGVAMGVLPEYRNLGVDALLYLETIKSATQKGFKWGEFGWVLENNDIMNRTVQNLGAEVYKTYRMYEKVF